MTARLSTASARIAAPLRSVEAYVLPRLVDVMPGAHGIVTAVDVVPHAVVTCGQRVATFDRAGPRRLEDATVVVEAPVTGLVTSCWISPGEMVRRSSPIITIASAENVLVSAKFPSNAVGHIWPGSVAVVASVRGEPIAAGIVCVTAPSEGLVGGRADERFTHVVLSVPRVPSEVLWPGTPVEIVFEE